MTRRAVVGEVIAHGPIPENVLWVEDKVENEHERGTDGLWYEDAVGVDAAPWTSERLLHEAAPLRVTKVRQ